MRVFGSKYKKLISCSISSKYYSIFIKPNMLINIDSKIDQEDVINMKKYLEKLKTKKIDSVKYLKNIDIIKIEMITKSENKDKRGAKYLQKNDLKINMIQYTHILIDSINYISSNKIKDVLLKFLELKDSDMISKVIIEKCIVNINERLKDIIKEDQYEIITMLFDIINIFHVKNQQDELNYLIQNSEFHLILEYASIKDVEKLIYHQRVKKDFEDVLKGFLSSLYGLHGYNVNTICKLCNDMQLQLDENLNNDIWNYIELEVHDQKEIDSHILEYAIRSRLVDKYESFQKYIRDKAQTLPLRINILYFLSIRDKGNKSFKIHLDQVNISTFNPDDIILIARTFPFSYKFIEGDSDIEQKFLTNFISFMIQDFKSIEELTMKDQVYLLIWAYQMSHRNQNSLLNILLINHVTKKFRNIKDALYIAGVLSYLGIIPDKICDKLKILDIEDRKKFTTSEFIYYIKLYTSLYRGTHEHNQLVYKGLSNIDELIPIMAKKLTLLEKCIVLNDLRKICIQNKNKHISEVIIQNLNMVDQKFFAAILLNLSNFSYNIIDYEKLNYEILKRFNHFTLDEHMWILRGLVWHHKGSNELWLKSLEYINKQHSKIAQNNNTACMLYQILFTLERSYDLFKGKINQYVTNIDMKVLENIYFGTGNLDIAENFSKIENEIKEILISLKINFEQQKVIALFKVDFLLINKQQIVEIYGRHHFTEKSMITGQTLFREKYLKSQGYKFITIYQQDWTQYRSYSKKFEYLQKVLEN